MHVIAPTDFVDNPLPNGTMITSKQQFENTVSENQIQLNNLLGWTKIYAPKKSGRLLITASCNTINAKEHTTIVFPGLATDFKISFKRNHSYADGNQVILFSTNSIQDSFRNTVSDGTLVSFIVTTAKGVQLHASGTTINGVAQARFLHPFEKDNWSVKAFITGAAESDIINLDFKAAVEDFTINLSKNNRTIGIHKIESFMKQVAPDGIPITLTVYDQEESSITTINTTSRLGKGEFTLKKEFYTPGNYTIEINTAGIIKRMNIALK